MAAPTPHRELPVALALERRPRAQLDRLDDTLAGAERDRSRSTRAHQLDHVRPVAVRELDAEGPIERSASSRNAASTSPITQPISFEAAYV